MNAVVISLLSCVYVCVCGHVTDVFLDQWRVQRGWGGWGGEV